MCYQIINTLSHMLFVTYAVIIYNRIKENDEVALMNAKECK